MFLVDAFRFRTLRFSSTFLALTLACLLLPVTAWAQAPGTCDGMQLGTTATADTVGGSLNGFVPFPANDPWNTNIANAAVDPNSAAIAATWTQRVLILTEPATLSTNFGSGTNAATLIPNDGIPYLVVDSSVTPSQTIDVYGANASESDVVVAPFPNTAGGVPIGGSANGTNYGGNADCTGWPESAPAGDNLALVLDRATCWLYETRGTTSCNGQYEAQSETIWDMTTGESRPWGWPSANTSGLPEFPGLVRYDEASTGTISHALAFMMSPTAGDSNDGYFVLPASYAASTTTTAHLLPMGARIRLKPSFNISGFATVNQGILNAMQNYGMILTDTGTNFTILGTPDARWDDTTLGNIAPVGTVAISAYLLAGTGPTLADFDVIDAPDGTTKMSPAYPGMDAVSAYTATNPDYAAGHAKPVINSFTVNGHSGGYTTFPAGYPVTFEFSVTGDSYDYIDNIGPVRLTDGSGSVTINTTTTQAYTLYSTNAWGRASNTLQLTVNNSVVAPPVFNPTPAQTGVLTAPRKITISTPTSPSATIYYTTDGSTPTTSSTNFTGTLTVEPTCAPPGTIPAAETVSAIATVSGYAAPSAVSTATYSCGAVTPTPTFSPAAGTYNTPQTVTISDTGASIYYTTDGSTPTTNSTAYSGAISVAVTQTLKAIAVAPGDATSAVGSAAYTIRVAAPVFTPAAGSYTSVQTVTISDSNAGATIYYTITGGTTGTTPTTANVIQYTGPITVNTTSTIEAVAAAPGYTNSVVVTAIYTINLGTATPTPGFSPAPGSYGTTQTVTISDSNGSASIYYTLTAGAIGTAPTNPPNASTHLYTGPVTIATTSVLEAIAWVSGDNNSAVRTGAYTLTNTIATPTFSPAGTILNQRTAPITVTIGDTTAGVTIYYTTDGTAPTTASTQYTAPIPGVISTAAAGTVKVEALAVKAGYQNSTVGTINYYFNLPNLPEPAFSPGSGVYAGVQTVTISDSTAGTSIYYTVTSGTTGTTPTTASSLYTAPVSVTPPSVVEAMAAELDYVNSIVAVATYSAQTPAPTPTFAPPAGSYAVAQNVAIGDGAPGAAIYYTTDGTPPTTSSARYAVPIPIVGAAASTTLQAIATAANYTTSAVGTAVYTIPTPPVLTTPTPGTQLPGTSVAFAWTPGSVATHFELWLGSTGPGSSDLYNSGSITGTTTTANNLPNNGETVYARLYYLIYGHWYTTDYTYTAYGTAVMPAITSPIPGTTLPGTTAPFTWSTGNIATEYRLVVGTGAGGATIIYDSGPVTATTETVNSLPTNGGTVTVRLEYLVSGAWQYTDYTYTAAGAVTLPALTSPMPNTTTPLTGTSVTFGWTPGNTATHFEFWMGTTGRGLEQPLQLGERDSHDRDRGWAAEQRGDVVCAALLPDQRSLAVDRLHLCGVGRADTGDTYRSGSEQQAIRDRSELLVESRQQSDTL